MWVTRLNNDIRKDNKQKNKLRTYRLFKQSFSREPYLVQIKSRETRVMLTKFRISSHTLHIESGRHPWKAENLRLCTLCSNQCVENELHFMLQCDAYSNYRTVFENNIAKENCNFCMLSDIDKFIWLLSNEDRHLNNRMGKYILQCFETRANLLQNLMSNGPWARKWLFGLTIWLLSADTISIM